MKTLIFIPGYNCEKQIVRVLEQFDCNILPYISEILFVNNRSTDATEQVAMDFLEKNPNIPLKIVRNKENYNLGGSHKVAFHYAIQNKFDYVCVLHGDDQGDIHDFENVLKNLDQTSPDMTLGARFMKGSQLKGYSKFRIFGNKVYNSLFSFVLRKKIYDLGSGLNLYKVDSLKEQYYDKFPDNLEFNYCMVMAISSYQQTYQFIPISWREEDQISNVKMASQAFSVLWMLFRYMIFRKKFLVSDLRKTPIQNYRFDTIGMSPVLKKEEELANE